MSICVITIEITDLKPTDFNFDEYSIIFCTSLKDWEGEIKLKEKNTITNKQKLQKEIKYTIKMSKNYSLIGISDLLIPSQVLSKKESAYEQELTLTMTDSSKKLLFGSSKPLKDIAIKFKVKCNIQYQAEKSKPKSAVGKTNKRSNSQKDEHVIIDKKDKAPMLDIKKSYNFNNNININNPKIDKLKNRKLQTPNKLKAVNKKNLLHLNNEPDKKETKENKDVKEVKNEVNIKPIQPNAEPAKESPAKNDNLENLKENKESNQSKQISQSLENVQVNPQSNNKGLLPNLRAKPINEIDQNYKQLDVNDDDDGSLDEVISQEIKPDNENFLDFYNNYIKENQLSDVLKTSDIDSLSNQTKNLIKNIFTFQKMFYEKFNPSVKLNEKIKKSLLKYILKYRYVLKQQHKLEELNKTNDDRLNIVVNKHRTEISQMNDLIPLRKEEMDMFKMIYNNIDLTDFNDNKPKNEKDEIKKIEIENLKNDENDYVSIINILIRKYGSLCNVFKGKNDVDIKEINQIENKYGFPRNFESIRKIEEEKLVIANEMDDNDIKLEKYLRTFYAKRKIVKIPFVKTTPNNYEYGTQKVIIKNEGDVFRVRYIGGYILLDKFLEMNSAIEVKKAENKKKNEVKKKIKK